MIPIVTARALKLVGAHPAVSDVRILGDNNDGLVIAEIDVKTELPAAWRLAGESPSGVRGLEPVTVVFDARYPIRAPLIALRQDFNRSHPHINPGRADRPPVPCIVDGNAAELVQSRGIDGLIGQLADWLDRASMVVLNDPERGWEPVRRDGIDDIMVVDGDAQRAMATAGGGSILTATTYALREVDGSRVYIIDQSDCTPVAVRSARFGRAKIADGLWRGKSVGLVVWAADTSTSPFVVSDYLPETVTTVGELRARAALYGCQVEFDAILNQVAVGLDPIVFEPMPLTITFLVRRPYDVIGTTSPIELCSYLIHVTRGKDLILEDDPIVRLCAPRERLSISMLRRASGEVEAPGHAPWTLVGCGSVGSKIAVHMAKRGHGPSRLVDRRSMAPHNYARHALLPPPDFIQSLEFKATMLADALASLRQRPEVDAVDAIGALSTPDARTALASRDAGLLNTTASSVLRETLAFADWADRPVIGEAHLLGAGRAGYVSFEGHNGNPNLSDLAVESYRLISRDPDLARSVFSVDAEAVDIGQGCSAYTFPMPDSRLSALAAGLAECVAMRHFPRRAVTGEIRLGKLGADGVSQTWIQEEVRPWTLLQTGGFKVRISARVDEAIRAEIAARPDTETGGVIVGRFSQIGEAFQVVDILPAPPDSTFSPEKFVLGTIGLKDAIGKLLRESGNSLYVLGTWHNHLVQCGPSALDAQTAMRLAIRQFFPILMLIALPDGYTALVAEAFDPDVIGGARAAGTASASDVG